MHPGGKSHFLPFSWAAFEATRIMFILLEGLPASHLTPDQLDILAR